MMMRGFHQQLQLSAERYDITAVSGVSCQLVKVDKLFHRRIALITWKKK